MATWKFCRIKNLWKKKKMIVEFYCRTISGVGKCQDHYWIAIPCSFLRQGISRTKFAKFDHFFAVSIKNSIFFFLFDSKEKNPQIHSWEHNCWSDQFCPSIQFLIKFCTSFFSIDFKSFVFIKVRTQSHCHKSGKAKLTCTKLLGNSKVEAIFLRNLILSSN